MTELRKSSVPHPTPPPAVVFRAGRLEKNARITRYGVCICVRSAKIWTSNCCIRKVLITYFRRLTDLGHSRRKWTRIRIVLLYLYYCEQYSCNLCQILFYNFNITCYSGMWTYINTLVEFNIIIFNRYTYLLIILCVTNNVNYCLN